MEETKSGINLKQFKKWLEKNVGKKCKEYTVGCLACQAWKIYEDLKSLLEF